MYIVIFKTIEKDEKDGFAKLWVREAKDLVALEKLMRQMEGGAWYAWKVISGKKIKQRKEAKK